MKATLFVFENDTDHAQAKALIERLMGSRDPADQGADDRSGAFDRSFRTCSLAKSCTVAAGSVDLSDGPAWNVACRSRTPIGNTQSSERSADGQARAEYVHGAQASGAVPYLGRFADFAGTAPGATA
jgi:hypothetical protein